MAQDFKICRLCISRTRIYFDLNENINSTMLEAITAIKVDSLDTSESFMCLKCRLNLRLAYAIQQNMLKCYEEFQNAVSFETSSVCIKEEPLDPCPELIIIKEEHVEATASVITSKLKPSLQCNECPKSFTSRIALKCHFTTHHQKRKCDICNAEYVLSNYHKHLESHTNQNKSPVVRVPPSKQSSRRQRLLQKITYYMCEGCNREFSRKGLLERHQKKMHGGPPMDMCGTCGKKFFSLDALRDHRDRVHLNMKWYTCALCRRDFSSPLALSNHKMQQHSTKALYKCPMCGDGFRQRVSWRSHMTCKHGVVPEQTKCQWGLPNEVCVRFCTHDETQAGDGQGT